MHGVNDSGVYLGFLIPPCAPLRYTGIWHSDDGP